MPLVTLEALAHDRPVVATNWRAMMDVVTPEVGILVPPDRNGALAAALLRISERPPAPGWCRSHFLAHFTLERHLAGVAAALRTLMKNAARATHSLGGSVAAAQEFNGHCPRRSKPVLIDAQALTR